MTSAAVVFEEQRAATTVQDVQAPAMRAVPAPVTAPKASRALLGALVLAQGTWLGVLGFVAIKLF